MKFILIPLGIFLVVILLLGVYLSPDDLAKCDPSPSAKEGCLKADAIAVVSGGNTSVRTIEAIRLYKAGWANYLIVSGAAADPNSPSNAEIMKRQAIAAGIPEDAIIADPLARTTKQNAEETEAKTKDYEISRLIVVTSPYHQRRAGLEFKLNMPTNTTIINHPAPGDPDWPTLWWLTPRGWWLAVGELIKIGATHAGQSQ